MAQGSQRKPSSANNTKSILFVNSITTKESATSNAGKWRWQSSLQRLSSPFHSQDWLADVFILSYPSRETHYGIAALSQKRKTSIQVIFTQSSVSMTTTSEYLPDSGFNVPSLHLSQSLRLHPFQVSLPVTLSNCASSNSNNFKRKTWTQTHNKGFRFVSSFIKQFPLPTKSRPSPVTHYMFHPSTFTTAAQNHECYLMHLKNQNQHSQTGKHSPLCSFLLTVRCQPTTSTPCSTVPSVPWRFLLFFLSQHSSA